MKFWPGGCPRSLTFGDLGKLNPQASFSHIEDAPLRNSRSVPEAVVKCGMFPGRSRRVH